MKNYRRGLLATTVLVGASVSATAAFAQSNETQGPPVAPVQEPVIGNNALQAVDETQPGTDNAPATSSNEQIVVTGSRIARPNLTSNSPIAVVTGEQTTKNADITLETFLNTLPQVNPAGTTTSNNPPNGGQASIDLRGLGSTRNLVLVDGRRPMVSSAGLSVDLNTIPQGLIERIDVITGGAGAAYGADAIAGVVNIILKNNFEGIELRGTYANSMPEMDAREYQVSGLLGANFADGRGNVAITVEYADRQALGKIQRPFAQQATSTTPTPPTGRLVPAAGNGIPVSAINALFATYGIAPGSGPQNGSRIGFNTDGTLFGTGVFNTPEDVTNYKYDPLGLDGAAANQLYFPDFYSYNFDLTNYLVLPLKRRSVFARGHYEIDPHAEIFMQGGYTEYTATQGLAATPVGTQVNNPCNPNPLRAVSNLVVCGINPATGLPRSSAAIVVPVTNPFIPADLRTLLNARTGDNPNLVGAGAAEPFRVAKRFLDTGLRIFENNNQVLQGLVGLRGEIMPRWRYEVSYSWGRTFLEGIQGGAVDVQRVQNLLESPTGGTDLCAGGFNPFGVNPLSQECVDYIGGPPYRATTTFTQKIMQGFITGEVADLPAGPLSVVLGAEQRKFTYVVDAGQLNGPIAGPNAVTDAEGNNSFKDIFGEIRIPLAKDAPWARSADINLSYRHSTSEFFDVTQDLKSDAQGSDAYGITASWEPIDRLRLRGSFQHSVRAPSFGELFSAGGSFPQIFDPCSINTAFRQNGGAAAADLCTATGVSGVNTFVATPGAQAFIGVSGSTDLKPESANTWTLGGTFQKWGFTGSLDYYRIKIKDVIFGADPNAVISACYGNFGFNDALDPTSPYCAGIARSPDIYFITVLPELGGDASGYFTGINQGYTKTSGIDAQLAYNLPTDFIRGGSRLSMNLFVNYLIDFTNEVLPGLPIDYSGTVAFFGAGLSQSFPRWKGNLSLAWNMKPFTFDTRIRYIHSMSNRMAKLFPNEAAQFSGVGKVVYVDLGAQVDIRPLSLRIGLNNAFDRSPPQYAPNVQSGTDPSLYDVIGRRAYVSATVRF